MSQSSQNKRHTQGQAIRQDTHDMLLLLQTIALSGEVDGPMKLAKLNFFFDLECFERGAHGYYSEIFRYTHGAYSKQIDQKRDLLSRSGLIDIDADANAPALTGETMRLSPRGQQLSDEIAGNLGRHPALQVLQTVVAERSPASGEDLKAAHYAIQVKGKTIQDYRQNEAIFSGDDFGNQADLLADLPDQEVGRLYGQLVFPETFARPLTYIDEPLDTTALRQSM